MTTAIVNNDVNSDVLQSTVPDNEVQNTAPVKDPALSFIDKHVHPPSAVPGYLGMPTNDTRTQVLTQWTGLQSNILPSIPDAFGLPPIPAVASQIDGFAILHTTGIRHGNIFFFRQNGDNPGWHQDVANSKRLTVYDTNRFQYDAIKFRPAFRSTTITLNATAFNDVGILSTAQFNPPLLFAGEIYNLSEQHPRKFEAFIKAYIKSHKTVGIKKADISKFNPAHHSLLTKSLQVDAPPTIRKNADGYEEVIPPVNLDPNTRIQFISVGKQGNTESGNQLGSIVPTHEQVINYSARSYGGSAKDGNFVVQRINTVAPRWLTAANDNATTNVNAGMYECYACYEDYLGVDNFLPFTELAADGINCRSLLDVQWTDDMTWAWTLMTGLIPNTNIGTSAINPDLLVTKTYVGTEIQPAAQSAWSGMQQPSPRPNMDAMQALMEAYYDLKDGMPAKYNFAGLASVARFAARKVVPAVVKSFTKRRPTKSKKSRGNAGNSRARSSSRNRYNTEPSRRTRSRGRSNRSVRYSDYEEGWVDPSEYLPRRSQSRSRRRSSSRSRPIQSKTYYNSNYRGRKQEAKRAERDLDDAEKQISKLKMQ